MIVNGILFETSDNQIIENQYSTISHLTEMSLHLARQVNHFLPISTWKKIKREWYQ